MNNGGPSHDETRGKTHDKCNSTPKTIDRRQFVLRLAAFVFTAGGLKALNERRSEDGRTYGESDYGV